MQNERDSSAIKSTLGGVKLVQKIGELLQEKKQFMSVAESCTGGRIAAEITQYPNASSTFKGGAVVYETSLKTKILGIPAAYIEKYNVVSEEVAKMMAIRSCRVFDSQYAISTTGIAGPSKGEGEDPIGTVCIGIATPEGVITKKFNFGKDRSEVIEKALNTAFDMLYSELIK
ncbi:MAG: CinA family protein [Bacteroidetes bacterium]|jgi:nicotinamide-nucleotide amidase|nr:CinA family protein [Bacteroidota bacterium]